MNTENASSHLAIEKIQEQLEDAGQIKFWRKLSPYEKPTIVISHGQEEEEEKYMSEDLVYLFCLDVA